MTNKRTMVFAALALFLAGQMISPIKAQETSGPVKAVQLMGVAGIKDQAKGTLKVENGNLQFVHGGKHSDLVHGRGCTIIVALNTQFPRRLNVGH